MTSPPALPLLAARELGAPLAWRAGRPISGHDFLAAAARLAERLPARGRPINLCQDRLHFALGLAAALQRGQTSLLPPNALPATLRQLPADGSPAYVLADAPDAPDAPDADFGGLHTVRVGFDYTYDTTFDARSDATFRAASGRADMPRIAAELAAVCLLTSGSTGAPQPHCKRFGPLTSNIGAEAARLAEWLQRPSLHGLAVVATVPAQHSYGLESSVLLALLGGASFDAGRPFYPADIAATLALLPRPRALVTTPFHLKALLQSGVVLPPVDLVLSATAPLSPQLAARAEAAMGGCLGEIYGCTEAGQVAARRTTQGETWTTLGELRIEREVGARGERGADGDASDASDERFIVHGGHVTEPTPLADQLVLHDAQHFQLLGRANDLIHVAGKRSSLAHLNFHLNRIDGVADGAFWLPEPGDLAAADAGRDGVVELEAVLRPIAFVVAPRLGAQQLKDALRAALEPAFVPRRIVHVPALPREATGKLTSAGLRAWALATLASLATSAATSAATYPATSLTAPAAAAADAAQGPEASAPLDSEDVYPIAADHPAFGGHFPGQPVLPGAVLLSLVMRSLQRPADLRELACAPVVIEQAKFLAPVRPGDTVHVRLRIEPRAQGTAVAFECRIGARVAARGQLATGPRR